MEHRIERILEERELANPAANRTFSNRNEEDLLARRLQRNRKVGTAVDPQVNVFTVHRPPCNLDFVTSGSGSYEDFAPVKKNRWNCSLLTCTFLVAPESWQQMSVICLAAPTIEREARQPALNHSRGHL